MLTGNVPIHQKWGDTVITQNIWSWSSSPGDLGIAEYIPSLQLIPASLWLREVAPVSLIYDQIEMFKNDSHSIEPCAKKKECSRYVDKIKQSINPQLNIGGGSSRLVCGLEVSEFELQSWY